MDWIQVFQVVTAILIAEVILTVTGFMLRMVRADGYRGR